jgi:hypothetical protein
MDERDFIDQLYAEWVKTTASDSAYWQPREGGVVAVDTEQNEIPIAVGMTAADADFVAAVHRCIPDLVRRVHEALDEADRADAERDGRECRIAELELEVAELKKLSTV